VCPTAAWSIRNEAGSNGGYQYSSLQELPSRSEGQHARRMSPASTTATQQARVLIVGGSIVGASAALFLAAHGVTPILVEKHHGISTRLRAKLFYPRSMEAYRAVGADTAVYAVQHSLPPADHAAVVTSLAGAELRRWRLPAAEDFSAVSPSPSALVKQADLEEIVRGHARAAGADLRFGHRLVALDTFDDRVVAHVVGDDGQPYAIEAEYVLAADGNRSAIRERLGITRGGPGTVAHVMEVGFVADLRAALADRRLAFAFVDRLGHPFVSWSTAYDGGAITLIHDPAGDPASAYDPVRCQQIASQVLGLPIERISTTYTRTWEMSGWVVDSYRAGRVFLLGDAVHVTPPVGGFGANTGIQDAWNLTTKLVTVLRGHADPALLDDYEPERRAVGRLTVDQALRRLGDRAPTHVPDIPLLSEAAVALGYRYRLSDPTGTRPTGPDADEPDRWHGEPGTRLPHLPLDSATSGDRASSTLDLVRNGNYLLLTGPNGGGWQRAADTVDAGHAFLDVTVLPRRQHTDALPSPSMLGIDDDGALLVRPDHVVTWRIAASPLTDTDRTAALHRALTDAHLFTP
jgi:putative polyketide hydroxylase